VRDERRIDVADRWPINAIEKVVLLYLIDSEPLVLATYQPETS
jgi:hypothetical protein